jgi:hypothetical protein
LLGWVILESGENYSPMPLIEAEDEPILAIGLRRGYSPQQIGRITILAFMDVLDLFTETLGDQTLRFLGFF